MNASEQILVIEDHQAIRILLSHYLSKDFVVKTVESGYKALAWMNQGNYPELIILDINMPQLNGIEFLSNIRNSGFFHTIPVIVVSGEEEGNLIEKCIDLGINGYMKKPFSPSELQSKIFTVLKNDRKTLGTAK
ncbi:MAG: response regulator [Bacteroidota bacterium]